MPVCYLTNMRPMQPSCNCHPSTRTIKHMNLLHIWPDFHVSLTLAWLQCMFHLTVSATTLCRQPSQLFNIMNARENELSTNPRTVSKQDIRRIWKSCLESCLDVRYQNIHKLGTDTSTAACRYYLLAVQHLKSGTQCLGPGP